MDSSCCHNIEVAVEMKLENKTDNKANILQDNGNSTVVVHQVTDDLDRKDCNEDNQIIPQCSNTITDSEKVSSLLTESSSSANLSLESSLENIASISINIETGSSKTDFDDVYAENETDCSEKLESGTSTDVSESSTTNRLNEKSPKYETIEDSDTKDLLKCLDDLSESCSSYQKGNDHFNHLREQGLEISNVKNYSASPNTISSHEISRNYKEPAKQGTAKEINLSEDHLVDMDIEIDHNLSTSQQSYKEDSCLCADDMDIEMDHNLSPSRRQEDSCFCSCENNETPNNKISTTDTSKRLWRKRSFETSSLSPSPHSVKKLYSQSSPTSILDDWPSNTPGSKITVTSVEESLELKQWLHTFQSWSNTEKIQAIDALISRCAASHVRYMMKAIEPLFQRDFISLLPKELALSVLSYLQPKDLLRAAQTCRYWKFLADDNLLWKEQCNRIGITTLKKLPRSLLHCSSPWKAAYMRQYFIENNWITKSVNDPLVMTGHDDHVITCLQFYGNRILSGSDDTTLKVWSAITGKCLRTLVGHSGGVWSSQMVGDLIISGSTDRTLRVWNAKTGKCLKVLAGHTSTVRCMCLHQNRVVSGSRDATLRVWSIPDGRCLRVLVGHMAAVRCVQYDGKVVVSGAYDYYVKVWNPETGECLHTLAGHTNRVYSLQFDGVHVVSGSLDTSIRVWDVESGQLKHTLTGHQSLTSGMELLSNILVSGNADSTVKVWDITTGHCLHTLAGPNKHQSAVTCLQSSNRFVITSSDDGTVKLWDVRTGEFIRNLVELSSGGSGGVVWRIRASDTKLICAVGSRNGTEETKLLVFDFDVPGTSLESSE